MFTNKTAKANAPLNATTSVLQAKGKGRNGNGGSSPKIKESAGILQMKGQRPPRGGGSPNTTTLSSTTD